MINVTVEDKQEALMVRYLLGLATKKERTQVEERYFSESEYLDQLLAVEDSLIDDFVTGRMPVEQRSAFKEAFRLRKEDVRFARALIQGVTQKKLDQPTLDPERRLHAPPHPLFARTRSFRLAVSIAAVALIALSIVLFLRNQSLQNRLSETENQLASLKKEKEVMQQELSEARSQRESSARELEVERNRRIDAGNTLQNQERSESPNKSSDLKTVVLGATFISRGATGPTREVRLSDNVRRLQFVVPVKGYGGYGSYSISIKLAGQPELLERGSLKPNPVSRELALTVPATNLRPGDYILTLFGERPGAPPTELERYSFRITG